MGVIRSKITAQGQISVPARIRQRLGLAPGSVIEWSDDGSEIVVRRAGKHTSEDLHRILFADSPPKPATADDIKGAIRDHVTKRHARR